MESATCCGMELARSAVWNHHKVMYGINPKENARWRVMPYAYGDSILTCGEITYQSFGLNRKKTVRKRSFFLKRSPTNASEQSEQRLAIARDTVVVRRACHLKNHAARHACNPQFACGMESRQSLVCNQSEDNTPAAIPYSPAVRLHTNPSDWIEKRPS